MPHYDDHRPSGHSWSYLVNTIIWIFEVILLIYVHEKHHDHWQWLQPVITVVVFTYRNRYQLHQPPLYFFLFMGFTTAHLVNYDLLWASWSSLRILLSTTFFSFLFHVHMYKQYQTHYIHINTLDYSINS